MLPKARRDHLLISPFDDEIIVYDTQNDRAHCLNPTAALIWSYADGKTSMEEGLKRLKRDLHPDADNDVLNNGIDLLQEAQLVESNSDSLDNTGKEDELEPADTGMPHRRTISRRQLLRVTTGLPFAVPTIISILSPTPAMAFSLPLPTDEEDNGSGGGPGGGSGGGPGLAFLPALFPLFLGTGSKGAGPLITSPLTVPTQIASNLPEAVVPTPPGQSLIVPASPLESTPTLISPPRGADIPKKQTPVPVKKRPKTSTPRRNKGELPETGGNPLQYVVWGAAIAAIGVLLHEQDNKKEETLTISDVKHSSEGNDQPHLRKNYGIKTVHEESADIPVWSNWRNYLTKFSSRLSR